MILLIIIASFCFITMSIALILLGKEKSHSRMQEAEINRLGANLTAAGSELELERRHCAEQARLSEDHHREVLDHERDAFKAISAEAEGLRTRCAQLESELARANERLDILNNEKERLDLEYEARFKRLAKEILDDSSKTVTERHARQLDELISPFRSNFEQFRKDFTESYDREARERYSLLDQIRQLADTSRDVSKEARRLTDALKGNTKVQGDWGELILENILDQSGLEKGRDYILQETATGEDGKRIRPDALVRLPGGKCIVIDSKVSLSAYLEMQNADNADAQRKAADSHLVSVKKHVAELAKKNYQDFIGQDKLDFVIMFIPGEAPYTAAMTLDAGLWHWAYTQRVMMISPTNLCVTLRLIFQIWSKEKSTANAVRITEEASRMLEKFTAFLEDMDKVNKSMTSARKSLDDAMTKLSDGKGNLIKRGENLKALGIKTKKQFPDTFLENRSEDLPSSSAE